MTCLVFAGSPTSFESNSRNLGRMNRCNRCNFTILTAFSANSPKVVTFFERLPLTLTLTRSLIRSYFPPHRLHHPYLFFMLLLHIYPHLSHHRRNLKEVQALEPFCWPMRVFYFILPVDVLWLTQAFVSSIPLLAFAKVFPFLRVAFWAENFLFLFFEVLFRRFFSFPPPSQATFVLWQN